VGVEFNHEISNKGQWRYSMTPQLHLDLNSHMTVQAGAGVSKLNAANKSEKLFALRMIYAF
jgi:2-hydroxy-3-keto-5-methylthiopentenyl-1-phosphate phosphatase